MITERSGIGSTGQGITPASGTPSQIANKRVERSIGESWKPVDSEIDKNRNFNARSHFATSAKIPGPDPDLVNVTVAIKPVARLCDAARIQSRRAAMDLITASVR